MAVIESTMAGMRRAKSFWDKDFHGLADQFLAAVSEQALHLRVDRKDPAVSTGYDNSVR